MEKKLVSRAQNIIALRKICMDKGLSHQQILSIVKPIGERKTVEEKEAEAERLISEVEKMF